MENTISGEVGAEGTVKASTVEKSKKEKCLPSKQEAIEILQSAIVLCQQVGIDVTMADYESTNIIFKFDGVTIDGENCLILVPKEPVKP